MASSNIKLFDENKGNMLSDSEFSISNQRMNGLQTGVASSQLQNKAMYQASLVAYAIAQVMMQNGKNANDTDAVSAFVANLSGTMLQKVRDLATTAEAKAGTATGKWMSPALVKAVFDYRKAATAEAQAGTNDTKWMSPALVKAAIDTLAAKAQNILSNETKVLYGLGTNAVPDDVFALTKTLVNNAQNSADSKAKIGFGSYTGNGAMTDKAKTLNFSFKPKVVIITGPGDSYKDNSYGFTIFMQGAAYSHINVGALNTTDVSSTYGYPFNLSWSGNSVTWKSTNNMDAAIGLNTNGRKYYYVAIG